MSVDDELVVLRRVLVVDDEALVRAGLARLLRGRNYEVVEAAGGAEALARLDRGEQFDAVLCDLMMAGIDGAMVFDAVRERHPALARRFVLITAGAVTPSMQALVDSGQVVVLVKPCRWHEIDAALRTVIDS